MATMEIPSEIIPGGKIIIPNRSLVGKLSEAFAAIGGVEKKGKNTVQGYNYVRAADVALAVRKELFTRGVIMTSDVEKTEWSDFTTAKGSRMTVCRLTVAYTLHDSDSTEKITFRGLGEAFDSGDKAVYKAHTGALKYALRTLGLIPDEKDDPEADEKVDQELSVPQFQQPQRKSQTLDSTNIPPVSFPNSTLPDHSPFEQDTESKTQRECQHIHVVPAGVSKKTGKPYKSFCKDCHKTL